MKRKAIGPLITFGRVDTVEEIVAEVLPTTPFMPHFIEKQ
jgi:hypothetical protein